MAVNLSKEAYKKLWGLVEISRDEVRDTWKPRLDRNRELYLGQHWQGAEDGSGFTSHGLREIAPNYIGRNIQQMLDAQTFQRPAFDAQVYPAYEEAQAPDPMMDPMGGGMADPMTGEMPLLGGYAGPTAPVLPDESEERRRNLLISERLNCLFEESNGWNACQEANLDKRWAGIGIVAVGWSMGEEEVPTQEEMEAFVAQLQDYEGLPGVDVRGMTFPQTTKGEGPRAWCISPYDFICDTTISSFRFQEAAYMGYFYAKDKESLERDAKLRGADKLPGIADLKTHEKYQLDPALESRPELKDHPYVILAKVFFRRVWLKSGYTDEETGVKYPAGYYPLEIVWSVDRPEEPLLCRVWKYDLRDKRGVRQYPFALLNHRPVPGKLMGQSAAEIGENQQMALNHSRSVEATYADKLARGKFLTRKGALDEPAKKALRSPVVGDAVEVDAEDLAGAIQPVPTPASRPEVMMLSEHSTRDLSALMGVTEAAQGVATEGTKRTATEISAIQSQSSVTQAKEDEEWEGFLSCVCDYLWQLYCQFKKPTDLSMNPVVDTVTATIPPAMGGSGSPQAHPMDASYLLPSKIRVVTGSTKQRNEAEEFQNTQAAIQMLAGLGLLASPANPIPEGYDAMYLVDRALKGLKIDTSDPALKDVGRYAEQAGLMQKAQMMDQLSQMAQQAGVDLSTLTGGMPQGGTEAAPPEAGRDVDPAMLAQLMGGMTE